MTEILRQEDFCSYESNFNTIGSTTSKGAQPKWYLPEEGLYLKQDMHGYESVSEWAVYNILNQCSTIPKEFLVPYSLCYIDDVESCYSKDFKNDEEEITLRSVGKPFRIKLSRLISGNTIEHNLGIIQDVLEKRTGKRFDYELRLLFAVDAFFLNEDRHLTNISILESSRGEYRLSPIFDNGMALLSRLDEYPLEQSIVENIPKVKPYIPDYDFANHSALYNYKPFLYKEKIRAFVRKYEEVLDRAGKVILYQLNQPHLQHLFIKTNNSLISKSI